jgi:hypothetical protein
MTSEGGFGGLGIGNPGSYGGASETSPGVSSDGAIDNSLSASLGASFKAGWNSLTETFDQIVDDGLKTLGNLRERGIATLKGLAKAGIKTFGNTVVNQADNALDIAIPDNNINLAEKWDGWAGLAAESSIDALVTTMEGFNMDVVPGYASYIGPKMAEGSAAMRTAQQIATERLALERSSRGGGSGVLTGKQGVRKDKARDLVTKRQRLGSRSYRGVYEPTGGKSNKATKRVIYK